MKIEKYEEELKVIGDVYGVGRQSRMKDLIIQGIAPESMNAFMVFTAAFGKVADDLAIFASDEGNLTVGWSYWVTDPAKQRRGGLTRRVTLELRATEVLYSRYGIDECWKSTKIDADDLKQIVEQHRSHRPG